VELFAGAQLIVRTVGPGVLALGGMLPVLAARAAVDEGAAAASGAVPSAMVVLLVVWAAVAWMGREG